MKYGIKQIDSFLKFMVYGLLIKIGVFLKNVWQMGRWYNRQTPVHRHQCNFINEQIELSDFSFSGVIRLLLFRGMREMNMVICYYYWQKH